MSSPTNWGPHTITIEEGQRQMVLMALAHLAVERPGWDDALREIAKLIDNPDLAVFSSFKLMHQPPETPDTWNRVSDEIRRLQRWVDDLQSGMYINCVYCGHNYGPRREVPATMALVLKKHIAECPQHPMHALLQVAKAAWHVCQSGLHNQSNGQCLITVDLVKEMSDALNATVEKAESPS